MKGTAGGSDGILQTRAFVTRSGRRQSDVYDYCWTRKGILDSPVSGT